MALTLESVVAELEAGRRHVGGVQGHQPRLAHGRPGQLRRHPRPDPAGPRHRPSTGPATPATAPPWPTALVGGGRRRLRRGDAPGRGHDPHRRAEAAGAPPRRGRRRHLAAGPRGRRRRPAQRALARTPELLPVLKQAGVVDAGGAGLPAAARRVPARGRRTAGARRRRRCPSRRRAGRSAAEVDDVHAERRRVRPPLRGHVLPRGAGRDDPRVQGGVGRHRRLDRRRRRRRHLELPHPHRRHRRRRSRPPSTAGRPQQHPGHRSARAGRGGALGARRRRRRPSEDGPRTTRCRAPSSPWPPARASAGSSARWACSRSWPAASR